MNRRAYQKPLRIIAAMTAVILGGGATIAVATATAANAAELSGVITNIDYAQPMPDPFPVGTTARFVADWTLPDSAQPGDTFTITLPTELAGTPATFPLVVPGTTEAVGTCVVSATTIVCTLGDYVATHKGISGKISFFANASHETDATEVTWTDSSGGVFHTPLPPGGITPKPPFPLPRGNTKFAQEGFEEGPELGLIRWYVGFDSSLTGNNSIDVTFVDTMDPTLTLEADSLVLQEATIATWDGTWTNVPVGTAAGQISFDTVTDNGFTATFHQARLDGTKVYRFTYLTAPPTDVVDGQSFHNKIVANGTVTLERDFAYQIANGSGYGDLTNGEVTWRKTDPAAGALAGSQWSLTGPDTNLTIVDNGAGDVNAAPGVITVDNLAWGEYTLVETVAPAGYVLAPTPIVFTIGAGSLVHDLGGVVNSPSPTQTPPVVTTTPPVETTPPTETTTPPPTTPGETTPAASTTTPPALATTGQADGWALLGGAAVLLTLLGVALVRTRRRQA